MNLLSVAMGLIVGLLAAPILMAATHDEPLAEDQVDLSPKTTANKPFFSRYDVESRQSLLAKGRALLSDVKDSTFGYDEEAFYFLVALVNKMPPDLLKPDEDGTPYAALLSLPSNFRGQPVTLHGAYFSVEPFRVPSLALRKDIPILYACTLREHPLNQVRPLATVVVIDDPTPYLKAMDDVRVKGYFYKVWKYDGTQGVGVAPLLIARRLEKEEVAPVDAGSYGSVVVGKLSVGIVLGVMAILFGGYLLARQYTRGKRGAIRSPVAHKFHLYRPGLPLASDTPPGKGIGSP